MNLSAMDSRWRCATANTQSSGPRRPRRIAGTGPDRLSLAQDRGTAQITGVCRQHHARLSLSPRPTADALATSTPFVCPTGGGPASSSKPTLAGRNTVFNALVSSDGGLTLAEWSAGAYLSARELNF